MRAGPIALCLIVALSAGSASAADVRIKDLGHFLGWRENALVGYGVVIGLGGSPSPDQRAEPSRRQRLP